MDLKDIFYTFGIISTFLIATFNAYIVLQNRKNPLREHLYKEQIAITSRLFIEFYKLNREIDILFNNSEKRIDNKIEEILNSIEDIMFENQFLISNEIVSLVNLSIKKTFDFYYAVCKSEKEEIENTYRKYYNEFYKVVSITRGYYGIDNLAEENKKVHGIPNYSTKKHIERILNN